MPDRRRIVLRQERDGRDWRNLWAYVDDDGNLHIDGQDLGPRTASVSPDGEYEWFESISAVDLPRLIEILGGTADTDVLDLLEQRYSGERSYEFERVLSTSGVPVERFVYY